MGGVSGLEVRGGREVEPQRIEVGCRLFIAWLQPVKWMGEVTWSGCTTNDER